MTKVYREGGEREKKELEGEGERESEGEQDELVFSYESLSEPSLVVDG